MQNCGAQPLFGGNAECTAFYTYKPMLRSLNHLFLKRHSTLFLTSMEGFAVASSAAGLVSLGLTVCRGLLEIYESVKGAQDDVNMS